MSYVQQLAASRRAFLARAGLTLAVGGLVGDRVVATTEPSIEPRSPARTIGMNDVIRVGLIGLGTMGTGHLRDLIALAAESKTIEIRALCDVYRRYRDRSRELAALKPQDVHLEYRDLLARDDVDAVFISTPDHWHAQMAIDAMAAGKDVYLEKPFTLTIQQAVDVAAAAQTFHRVLQVGSEWVTDPRLMKAREIVKTGGIGTPIWAQSSYGRNTIDGDWNYYVDEEGNPQSIDWQRWLGPAAPHEFSAERFFRWRKYWDYSNGIATDLWSHKLAPILSVVGGRYPTRVCGGGGIFRFKDRQVPDTLGMVIEYADFMTVFASSMANSTSNLCMKEAIHGNEGTLVFEPNRLLWYREDQLDGNKKLAGDPQVFDIPNPKKITWRNHRTNFFDCVRTRATPYMGCELALQTTVPLLLGMESYRQGMIHGYDSTKQVQTATPKSRPEFEGTGKNVPGGWPKNRET
jgi:predicted dehydrogenase